MAPLGLHCCIGFSLVVKAGTTPPCSVRAAHAPASLCRSFSCCREQSSGTRASVVVAPGSRAQAQYLWHTGLVAPWHVGSSRIRGRTWVSCVGRQILYHWATWEAWVKLSLISLCRLPSIQWLPHISAPLIYVMEKMQFPNYFPVSICYWDDGWAMMQKAWLPPKHNVVPLLLWTSRQGRHQQGSSNTLSSPQAPAPSPLSLLLSYRAALPLLSRSHFLSHLEILEFTSQFHFLKFSFTLECSWLTMLC